MGSGYLLVQVRAGNGALPVSGAHVTLLNMDGKPLYETYTDESGNTEPLELPAPPVEHTLNPDYDGPTVSMWIVNVESSGFKSSRIRGVEIVDTQKSILAVRMHPLSEGAGGDTNVETVIPPMGLLLPGGLQEGVPETLRLKGEKRPDLPREVVVHLGGPEEEAAANVTVGFAEYVKNVLSGEVYPTWPREAQLASLHAVVSLTLNRLHTGWYRGRGLPFDLTNDPAYDPYYRDGASVYESVGILVDGALPVCIRRRGFETPYFARYAGRGADGGLDKWESVSLAEKGMTPLGILRRYYPKDIELARLA